MTELLNQLDKKNLPELPRGWVWTRLSEVVDIRNGFAFKSSDYRDSGALLVRQSNLGHSKVNIDNAAYLPEAYLGKYPEFTVTKGAVLIGMSGSIGKLCLYNLDTAALQNQRTGLLEFFEPDMKPYVWYYLNTLERSLTTMARGVGVQNISAAQIKSYPISIPPLPEQHRIVAKIEELFTRLDAGVEALKKIKAQLKRYRQAVLKYAFEGRLTKEWRQAHKDEIEPASIFLERIKQERHKTAKAKYKELPPLDTADLSDLPEGWVWAKVGEIGLVETGNTPSKSQAAYYGRDYNFYKPTDLNAGYYTRESEDGLSSEGIKKARLLPERSILITCIGATIGKTGFIRQRGASNQQINAIIPDRNMLPEFLYFICISPQFQNGILSNASATTLPILSKRKFEVLELPLCPILEQHQAVEEIERRFSVADQIERTVDHSLKQAERLRHSILRRAFEGKLVPQDPNDEPAEKLLERIRQERARQQAEPKPAKSSRNKSNTKQMRLV